MTESESICSKIKNYSRRVELIIPHGGRVTGTIVETMAGLLLPKHMIDAYCSMLKKPDAFDENRMQEENLINDPRAQDVTFMVSVHDDLAILSQQENNDGIAISMTSLHPGDKIYSLTSRYKFNQNIIMGTVETINDGVYCPHSFAFIEEDGKDSFGNTGSSGKPLLMNSELIGLYIGVADKPNEQGYTVHYGVAVKDVLEGMFVPRTIRVIPPPFR